MESRGNTPKLPSFDIEGESLLDTVKEVVRGLYYRFPHWVLVCAPRDLVQEMLLRLLEKDGRRLRSFGERSSLETWLSRVAFNHIVSLQRRQGCLVPLEESSLTDYISQPEQEALLLDQERAEMFLWARSRLSESQRFLLDRLLRGDIGAAALAAELRISPDRLYDQKTKLIRRLRKLLREYGDGKSRS